MKKNILVKAGDRMVAQTVEMTQDEIAELTRQQAELPETKPAVEQQLADLSEHVNRLADLVLKLLRSGS